MGSGRRATPEHPWYAKFVGELVGTYFFVLTVGCSASSGTLSATLAIGAMALAMVYAIGPVSGAHLNPAVTTAVLLVKLPRTRVIDGGLAAYIVAQLLGGLLAGLTYVHFYGDVFRLEPGAYDWTTAATVEVLYTGALCYVVLSMSNSLSKGACQHSGMAVGFTISAAAVAIGGISGCSLNPAVSVGVATAHAVTSGLTAALHYLPMYLCTPFLGSALGVLMFHTAYPGSVL